MSSALLDATLNMREQLVRPWRYDPVPHDPDTRVAEQIEAKVEARRKELGVADDLKKIPGLTTLMLVALGEHGIKTIDDLAGCATESFCGWIEDRVWRGDQIPRRPSPV